METDLSKPVGLYPRLLGQAWLHLDETLRAAHLAGNDTVLRASGWFRIRHGSSRLGHWLPRLLRLPPEAEAVETRLVVTAYQDREHWDRWFGDCRMVSVQRACGGGLLGERFGGLELRFRLDVEEGALVYRQAGAFVWLGLISVPLPRWLAPQVAAREERGSAGQRTRVMVQVSAPCLGLMIHYAGEIEPQETA